MSKLIGTNPNQVPSNADLGSAAFIDKKEFLLSKGSSISAIDAIITRGAGESVIDVFIYDTNKDSDGGAWRKRTQHTSWYNEKLNTTERGSRREFPSVAVIVLSDYAITIYDADDPTLPMWMTFWRYVNGASSGTTTHWNGGGGVLRSIYALNGHMVLGGHSGGRGFFLIKDKMIVYYTPTGGLYKPGGGLIRRNEPYVAWVEVDSDYKQIVNQTINDVAMAVLPSAPIDADTGLPTPTIALATAGGVSILKDDGNVSNITWSNGSHSYLVTFIDNKVFVSHDFSGAVARHGHLFEIPYGNLTEGAYYSKGSAVEFYGPSGFKLAPSQESYVNITKQAGPAFGFAGYLAKYRGLAILERNTSSYTKSAVANITSSYNSGYMVGDIKLATLSDTDGTNIAFANKQLIDEPYFNASTGWYFNGSGVSGAGSTTGNGWSISGGKITQSGAGGDFYALIPVVDGKQYVMQLTFDTTGTSSFTNVSWGFRSLANSGYLHTMSTHASLVGNTANQTKNVFWTATTTGNIIARVYSSEALSIDNFTVHIAEEDRSVNSKGLQVLGTVPKTPVVTGADLVAYGPFTSSNYLQQPYNSDLDFGTGDFMYSMWIYRNSLPTSTYERWFGTASTSNDERIDIFSNANTDNIAFYSKDNGVVNGDIRVTGVGINKWHCFHFTRQGNVYKIYHDGELRGTSVGSSTLANYQGASGGRRTHIGASEHWDSGHAVLDGKIALAKISGTVPSPEQIKKIYEDEKALFQENAKATLYGTSDTPTALAYDDDTGLLHAGTSAGRSVFQGLRRVDNTTDAVGATISASNGMVAED